MAPKKKTATAASTKAGGKAAAKAAAASSAAGGDAGAVVGPRSLKEAAVVVTGEFDGMTRDQLFDKLKAAGAKVMSAVSGKTVFLIVGSRLEDGRPVEATSKYRKYLELKEAGKKCPELLQENETLALLGASSPAGTALPAVPRPAVVQPTFASATERAEPWVERHRPRGLNDLLGNASAVKKLTTWLRDWDDVVFRRRTKPVPFKPGGGVPDNVNARAALISGPPGIGKTTAARLVAKSLGWDNILEFNASDARGAKVINAMAEGLSDNRTLNFGSSSSSTLSASSATPALAQRCVIVMDEVDGMSAGDRGGNAALIKMIKKTKNPIICICNDHGNPKTRSLAFSCYDIRFQRPSKTTIAQRAADIAASEGLSVEPNAMEALAESCGNDVRHVLNQLQVMAKTPEYQSAGVGYTDMKDTLRSNGKDGTIMLNPFQACTNLLTASIVQKMETRERFDHFFVDHQLMHLMIQENYMNSVIRKPADDDLMQRCAQSAASIADGDIVSGRIMSHQAWNLLPDLGLMSAILPSFLTNGFVSFPEFPKFLGNYSKMSRARRLNGELQSILRLSSGVQRRQLASTGYVQLLFARIINCLEEEDIDGAAAILDAYGLQRDHIAEHLNELMQHLTGEDAFKLIDPKVKAAMTREMNSGTHTVKVFLPQVKRKRASVPEGEDLGEEGERDAAPKADEAEDDEEKKQEADEATLGGLVKRAKAKKASKAKAKAKPEESAPKAKAKAKAQLEARAEPKPLSKAKAKAEAAAQAKRDAKANAKAELSKAKARGAEPPAKRAKR